MSMRIDLRVLSSFDLIITTSTRIDLRVLSSFDLMITTSTSDSECECEEPSTISKTERKTVRGN